MLRSMTPTKLKLIAIVAMAFDHSLFLFINNGTLAYAALHVIGRIVTPIMCYMIAEGYHYTSNQMKYLKRLLFFTLISHFPYVIYFNLNWWETTSVFWGLSLGLLALIVFQKKNISKAVKLIVVLLCCILAFPGDWSFVSVLWILTFGIYRGNLYKQFIGFTVIGLIFYILPIVYSLGWIYAYRFGIFIAIPLLTLNNGQRSRNNNFMKYFFYAFYPLHFLLLIGIKVYLI